MGNTILTHLVNVKSLGGVAMPLEKTLFYSYFYTKKSSYDFKVFYDEHRYRMVLGDVM